jgi:hypothetical protein
MGYGLHREDFVEFDMLHYTLHKFLRDVSNETTGLYGAECL